MKKSTHLLKTFMHDLPHHEQYYAWSVVQEKKHRIRCRKLDSYYPDTGDYRRDLYPKHMAFFKGGKQYRERCFMAANRVGKTEGAGGYETVLHLTGRYPDWWVGRRFDHPIDAWAVGKTADTTRDILQYKLLGCTSLDSEMVGTGLIPADCLVRLTRRSGIPDCVQDIYIRHSSGGLSCLSFKSYKQGRGSFEGTAKHVIWLDEEPPEDIYAECLLRTMTVDGLLYLTFTPLEGISTVVQNFLNDDVDKL